MKTEPMQSIVLTRQDHNRLSTLASSGVGQYAKVAENLAYELDRARIVDPTEVQASVVTMNTRVTVRDDTTGQTRVFQLVYPGKEDISIGNLSVLTPIGVALIGLSEGDTLEWSTRDGQTKQLVVDKITYQPEANGRFEL